MAQRWITSFLNPKTLRLRSLESWKTTTITLTTTTSAITTKSSNVTLTSSHRLFIRPISPTDVRSFQQISFSTKTEANKKGGKENIESLKKGGKETSKKDKGATSSSSSISTPTPSTSTTTVSNSIPPEKENIHTIPISNHSDKRKAKEEEEEEECPSWQNPLHHKNPTYETIMLDEFPQGETPPIVPLPPLDDGSGKILAAPHLHALAEEIVHMSMLEVKELTDRVAEHFGFEDEDGDSGVDEDLYGRGHVDDSNAAGAAVQEVKEEKKTFDFKLVSFDEKSKIKVIKEIRAITNLGLKEAKELVEGAPKVVKKDIKKEEADELKAKLEAAGAKVEIL